MPKELGRGAVLVGVAQGGEAKGLHCRGVQTFTWQGRISWRCQGNSAHDSAHVFVKNRQTHCPDCFVHPPYKQDVAGSKPAAGIA
jgi:hypothetical protein